MDYEITHAVSADFLLKTLADELLRAAELIENISDDVYRKRANGAGSVGEHFRHNLDFFNAFLKGIESGKLDYNRRERDVKVEENRLYAANLFAETVYVLRELPVEFSGKKVLVRSEINADFWLESSAMRELEFLHSHTVHHHALIAVKLNSSGIQTANDFGVAPSTLKFWAKEKTAA